VSWKAEESRFLPGLVPTPPSPMRLWVRMTFAPRRNSLTMAVMTPAEREKQTSE